MAQAIFSGQYDWKLVALSIVLAFCACYTTVELTGRSVGSALNKRSFWLTGGALCIGVGLWGVHDLALLALNLPSLVPERLGTVGPSLLIAIACSGLGLLVVCWRPLKNSPLPNGAVSLAACLSAMLYSAIEGIRLGARPAHSFALIAVSVITTLAASFADFLLGRRRFESIPDSELADFQPDQKWFSPASAAVMAVAIALIQYAGVISVDFHSPAAAGSRVLDSYEISSKIVIIATALLLNVFGLSLVLSAATRVLINQRRTLHSEQERWRLVISANQDGLFDFDLISGEIFYSPRWKEIIGYGPHELEDTFETWQHRIHPEDKDTVDSAIETYLKSRHGTGEIEYRLRHRDGSFRWILARSQAVWDEHGNPLRLVGSNCDITARKQAAQELSASEARFSAFMQHSTCMAFIKDAQGTFVYTNPMLERVWKLKPDDWIGKSDHQIWPAPIAKRVAESDREVLSALARSETIEEFEMSDGRIHQFLTARFSFPETSAGRLLGGVSMDITDRMQSEEQFRSSEYRYRELFEHNPLPGWIYRTRDLRIIDVNQTAIDHYGWLRNQFLNLTIASLTIPGEAEASQSEPKTVSQKYRKTKPIHHRRNKRTDIWVELSSYEFESNGNVVRLVMANDVTDRIAAETAVEKQPVEYQHGYLETLATQRDAELEASQAKWHALVAALPQIVWSARRDGFCDYISPQLAAYTGVAVPDLVGWGWLRFVHPSDREQVRERWMTTLETGSDYDVEYRIRSKNGQYRWFVTRGRSIQATDSETATHWLGTTTDIEDQKRLKEQPDTVVAKATLAVAESRHHPEMAAPLNGELFASVGPEIRTPINGLSSEQLPYIESVQSGGHSPLLDLSKIDMGKIEHEEAEFDLQEMLEDSIELMAAPAADKGIRLSLNVGDGVPFHANGAAAPLRQALLTLLSNALKFTKQGSVSLSVCRDAPNNSSVQPRKDQCVTLRFGLQDTGIPLPAEEQARPSSESAEAGTFGFRVRILAVPSQLPSDFDELSGRHILLLTSSTEPPCNIARYLERARVVVVEDVLSDTSPRGDLAPSNGTSEHAHPAISLIISDVHALKDLSQRQWRQIDRCPLLILGAPAESSDYLFSPAQAVEYLPQPVRCLPLLKAIARILKSSVSNTSGDAKPQEEEEKRGAEILLVEDDQVNQLITTLFLAKLGCHVTTAGNGREACAALERQSYDLILMDCQMPDMDGFQATRIIREKERDKAPGHHHPTPIIALSAGVLKEERDRCYAAGMDDCLSKPLEKQELEAALSTWLPERNMTAQTAGR